MNQASCENRWEYDRKNFIWSSHIRETISINSVGDANNDQSPIRNYVFYQNWNSRKHLMQLAKTRAYQDK